MIDFTPFPTLSTERLNLRQLEPADENEVFSLRSNNIVRQYLDRPKANSVEDAKKFIERIKKGIAANQWLYWAVTTKNDKKLIGTVCLWNISKEKNSAEIGYELLPEHHGKGLMQEAVAKIVDFSFKTMKLDSLEAYTHPENSKSTMLLERNGFKYNGKNKVSMIYVKKAK
jgi:ribosomal-protein-alanine N-acetyltransferase